MSILNTQKQKVAVLNEEIKSLKVEYEAKIHELNKRIHHLILKCGELQFDRTMKPYITKIDAVNQPGKKRKREENEENSLGGENEFNMNLLHALDQEVINLKEKIKEIESEVETKNKNIQEGKQKLEEAEEKLKKIEEEFENFKKSPVATDFVEKLKSVTEVKEKMESQINKLKNENEKLVTDHNHQYLLKCCEVEALVKQSKRFHSKLEEVEKNLATLQKEKENLKVKEIKGEEENMNQKINEYKTKIQTSDIRIAELESEIKILTENIKVQNDNYQNEVTKQKESYEKQILEMNLKLKNSMENKEISILKTTIEKLNSEITQLKPKEGQLEKVKSKFEELNNDFTKIKSERDEFELKLIESTKEIDSLNKKTSLQKNSIPLEEVETLKNKIIELEKVNEESSKKRKTRDEEVISQTKKPKLEKIVVIFSGFNAKQKQYKEDVKEKLSKFVKDLKGTVASSEDDPSITHVVVPPGVRTYKALIASLKNKWIMSPAWVENSKKKSSFQNERDYGFQRTEEIFKNQKFYFTKQYQEAKPQYLKYAQKLINEDGTGRKY
eukprot:gene5106-8704_t